MNQGSEKRENSFLTTLKVIGAIAAIITAVVTTIRTIWHIKEKKSEQNEIKEFFGFCDAKNVTPKDEAFAGLTLKAVMSAVTIDLSSVSFTEESFVSVKSLMSAVTIIVPDTVKVVVDGRNNLSEVCDHCDHEFDEDMENTLYIAYSSSFSAISVKNANEE